MSTPLYVHVPNTQHVRLVLIKVWWQYLHCQWRHRLVRCHTRLLCLFCSTYDDENMTMCKYLHCQWLHHPSTLPYPHYCVPFTLTIWRPWQCINNSPASGTCVYTCGLGLSHFRALVCDLLSRMGISWKVGPHRSGALCWKTWYHLLGSPSRIWIWSTRWKQTTRRVYPNPVVPPH